MEPRRLLSLLAAAIVLSGCGAARPAAPAFKRAAPLAKRGADVVPLPTTSPELRLALAEEGFMRLRAAFPWQEQARRTDYYFDAWDGATFRRTVDRAAPKLRLKLRAGKLAWQIARVVERREVDRSGLPVELTVARSWQGELEPAAASHLLQRTEEFFLWLDAGGEPLRQRAREVDLAWRQLTWPGADLFFPVGQVPGFEPQALIPCAMKRRHGWKTELPPDVPGGGLRLFLHFDEARDGQGRWVDSFEIEAEPVEPLAPEAWEAAAVDFGRALAVAGLTTAEVGPEKDDAAPFTARQLQLQFR